MKHIRCTDVVFVLYNLSIQHMGQHSSVKNPAIKHIFLPMMTLQELATGYLRRHLVSLIVVSIRIVQVMFEGEDESETKASAADLSSAGPYQEESSPQGLSAAKHITSVWHCLLPHGTAR